MKTYLKTVLAGAALAAFAGTTAQAGGITPGLYRLGNHPGGGNNPPPYGLRLDELFNVTHGVDVFSFDFEAPQSNMFLNYDGSNIRIFGTAFGGRDVGTTYDPHWTSTVQIDFTYRKNVGSVPGDDDVWVDGQSHQNNGTVRWDATGQTFHLRDKQGSFPFSFRFGDKDDDQGHRGHDGISGWGWFYVNGSDKPGAQDWLFTATKVIPAPAAAFMGVAGLGLITVRRRRG